MTCAAFDARTKVAQFLGKTGSRTVPLSPAAVALFKRLSKGNAPGELLLARDDGKPWSHSDWDELVREAAAKAKLPPGVCLYTLRHSWITSALQGGLATLDVARLVGTSLMMIEKHYGHLVASAARTRLAKVAML
jgi:integrase